MENRINMKEHDQQAVRTNEQTTGQLYFPVHRYGSLLFCHVVVVVQSNPPKENETTKQPKIKNYRSSSSSECDSSNFRMGGGRHIPTTSGPQQHGTGSLLAIAFFDNGRKGMHADVMRDATFGITQWYNGTFVEKWTPIFLVVDETD